MRLSFIIFGSKTRSLSVNHRLFAPFLFKSNAEWRLSRKQIDSIKSRELWIIVLAYWSKATEGDENKSIFVNNEISSAGFETIFNFLFRFTSTSSSLFILSLSLSSLKAIMNALWWLIMKFESLKTFKCAAHHRRWTFLSLCDFKFLSNFLFDFIFDLFNELK